MFYYLITNKILLQVKVAMKKVNVSQFYLVLKNMKTKTIIKIIALLSILFLLFETINIFGWITLLISITTLATSYLILTQLIPSIQYVNDNKTQPDNRNWPKYLYTVIAIFIAMFLYSKLNSQMINTIEKWLGISLIISLVVIPSLMIFGKAFINRNDSIQINETTLTITDNGQSEIIQLSDIAIVKKEKDIIIDLNSGNRFIIDCKTLNLNYIDKYRLFKKLNNNGRKSIFSKL